MAPIRWNGSLPPAHQSKKKTNSHHKPLLTVQQPVRNNIEYVPKALAEYISITTQYPMTRFTVWQFIVQLMRTQLEWLHRKCYQTQITINPNKTPCTRLNMF